MGTLNVFAIHTIDRSWNYSRHILLIAANTIESAKEFAKEYEIDSIVHIKGLQYTGKPGFIDLY